MKEFNILDSIEDISEELGEEYIMALSKPISQFVINSREQTLTDSSKQVHSKPQNFNNYNSTNAKIEPRPQTEITSNYQNQTPAKAPSFEDIMAMFDGPKSKAPSKNENKVVTNKDNSVFTAINISTEPVLNSNIKLNGIGNQNSKLVFIGARENFENEAGDLFDKILGAMKLSRTNVFLMFEDELFEHKILEVISPKVIVVLGEKATQLLLQNSFTMTKHQFVKINKTDIIPTYSPQDIVKDATLKKPVWEDLKKVLTRI